LDPIGASNWQKNMKSLGMDGRWVLYGLMGGAKIDGDLLRQLLSKRGHLSATTLRTRPLAYKKELVDAFRASSVHKFSSKQFKPIIDSITTLDKVADAHTRMESNLNAGKIILKIANIETEKEEL